MNTIPGASVEQQIEHIARNVLDQDALSLAMQKAVAEGITAAVGNPMFWTVAGEAMQKQAQQATGSWVLGSIKAAFSRAGLAIMFVVGMTVFGGWPGLVTALKALAGGHTP